MSAMDEYEKDFPNRISNVCLSKFKTLGKTGKPKDDGEYTLLACIVKRDDHDKLEVVALGTGSKCIGAKHLPKNGDVLHDSHAEIIARRCFLLYLISQIKYAMSDNASIFKQQSDGKVELKPNISFHFYCSHTPCGDASIFPKQEWTQECCGEQIQIPELQSSINANFPPPLKKLKTSNEIDINPNNQIDPEPNFNCGPGYQNSLVDSEENNDASQIEENIQDTLSCLPDIHRTGAKCVNGEGSDPKGAGLDYHITGVLRTKPGRGDPTLSMSCSDKLFKWTVVGIQGALLLKYLAKPIYLQSLTIGNCPYSQEAMERALFSRFKEKLDHIKLPPIFQVTIPRFLKSNEEFQYSRSVVSRNCSDLDKMKPSPSSLIWSLTDIHSNKHEVSINGYKLGTTKKNLNTPKSWVSICRQSLLQHYFMLKERCSDDKSYRSMKRTSESYQKAWSTLKHHVLIHWTSKPDFTQNFEVEHIFSQKAISDKTKD